MKKLMGAVLASALMFPVGSANAAELLKNLKVSGNLDWQMNSARNVEDFNSALPDHIGNAGLRTMVHGDWDVLDDVHANVTLRKNDRQWGDAGAGGGGQAGTGGSQPIGTVGANVLGSIFVDRANVSIDKLLGHLDATVGRQWYGEPGDLIWYVGPRDTQQQNVSSIDALRVKAANDWMMFDGIAGVMTGSTLGSTAAAPDLHTDIRGFNLWWKGLPVKVNTFAWNRVTHVSGGAAVNPGAASSANDNLYVYGVKLRGEAAGGWFNLDLAKNAGECRGGAAGTCGLAAGDASNYTGHAALLELGFNGDVANVGGIAPWASFGWGSGRSDMDSGTNDAFQSIGSDWRPGVINRRFSAAGTGGTDTLGSTAPGFAMATTGLTNRVVWGLGTNFTPAAVDQLTAGVQLWDYRLQRNDNKNVATPAAATGNKHLGTELDLTASWRHSENVSLSAGWARYYTGGFVKEQLVSDSPATFMYTDISIKF